jgi:hypothetical protein
MKLKKLLFLSAWFIVICSPLILTRSIQASNGMPQPAVRTGNLIVFDESTDHRAAEDVARALRAQRETICAQLQIECSFPIVVELFPSQASFDEHVMNPNFRGFYAISGQHKIQMVSPNVSPAGRSVPYEGRVEIAVHEFIHLALDEIDPELPAWLDEGSAVYLGPHEIYDQACQQVFPFDRVPWLQDLMESYPAIPAADLYAYTLVRFIVEQDGIRALNQLLRTQTRRAEYIETYPGGFEKGWHSFLWKTCSGPGKSNSNEDFVN